MFSLTKLAFYRQKRKKKELSLKTTHANSVAWRAFFTTNVYILHSVFSLSLGMNRLRVYACVSVVIIFKIILNYEELNVCNLRRVVKLT